jgi:hypothetical protein
MIKRRFAKQIKFMVCKQTSKRLLNANYILSHIGMVLACLLVVYYQSYIGYLTVFMLYFFIMGLVSRFWMDIIETEKGGS